MAGTGTGHRPENLILGAALTTAAFFCVALVGTLAKVSGQYTSTGVLLLFQNLLCLAFMAPVVARGGWPLLRTDKVGLHFLRAVTGTACWYALFVAIKQIPLANATLLTYSAPLWMPLIAWLVSRRPVARATWIGAAIGFAGVILVLQPHAHRFAAGELFALAGALMLAVAMMSVRWLGATEPVTRILVYVLARETHRMNTRPSASAPFALRANEQSAPSGLADIGGGNQLLRDAGITQARPRAALGDGAVVVDGP